MKSALEIVLCIQLCLLVPLSFVNRLSALRNWRFALYLRGWNIAYRRVVGTFTSRTFVPFGYHHDIHHNSGRTVLCRSIALENYLKNRSLSSTGNSKHPRGADYWM